MDTQTLCKTLELERLEVNLFRGTTPAFVPGLGTLVQSTASLQWNDPVAQGYTYYYKIAAEDHAGNQSAAVAPGTTTGVEDSRTPREYLRLLKAGSAEQRELRGLTSALEQSWYGQREANAEEFGAAYISSGYRDAMGFLLIIAILLVKPTGLFAQKVRIG